MISKKKNDTGSCCLFVVAVVVLFLLFISERGALSLRDHLITKTKTNLTQENTKA